MKPRRTGLHVAGALWIPARLDPVARGQIDAFSDPDISIWQLAYALLIAWSRYSMLTCSSGAPAVQIALLVAHAHLSGGKKIPTLQTFISNGVTIFNH